MSGFSFQTSRDLKRSVDMINDNVRSRTIKGTFEYSDDDEVPKRCYKCGKHICEDCCMMVVEISYHCDVCEDFEGHARYFNIMQP